jgi:periplasmic protein TonB
MHNNIVEELDHNIDALLMGADIAESSDPILRELAALSRQLQQMPSAEFQQRLLHDLIDQTDREKRLQLIACDERDEERILPTLFGEGTGLYRVNARSYALSLAAHAAILALVLTSGLWMAKESKLANASLTEVSTEITAYLPPATTESRGGGGGGSHETIGAPNGALPKASTQQIAPPMVVRNESAKLEVEPTVMLPPTAKLPQLGPIGDPMSRLSTLSNGTGTDSGVGSGTGGGIGSGIGPGVGDGRGGGMGGGIFHVGGGVSAPRAIYAPDPDYSEEARKARYQGSVQLYVIVDSAGHPRDIKVSRSLGMGLDEKAVAAVKTWRFEPAMKDGHPVAVQINVEVFFHLY